MINAITISPPICPKFTTPDRSTISAIVLPFTVATARIASRIPTRPSPAIIPEQQSTPLLITLSLFAFPSYTFSKIRRRIPPTIMQAESSIGRYKPIAKGRTGIDSSSTIIAINTPINTNVHGRFPPITPSTIIFIKVA